MSSKDSQQAILYAAKSTEDTRGSIPGQLGDGRSYAGDRGLEVVAEYSEQDVSAYKGNRGPELAAALEHVERIRGTLIAQHSDRLARGDGLQARHLVEIALWARRTGVTILCIQDPSTFESLVLAAAMGDRNMEDSRRKSAAVIAGIARRQAAGRHIGPRSYGFSYVRDEEDQRVLVPDPEQAPVVERIFDRYLGGTTKFQIARALNADGIPTLRGGMWKPEVVGSILANPLHAGLVRSAGELIDGRHRAIIPERRWREAQSRRARLRTKRVRGRVSIGRHLLRKGFLRCGKCGETMIVRSERNADGTLYETYRCHGHYLDPQSCSLEPQRREPIDTAVYAYFRQAGLAASQSRLRLSEAVERRLKDLRALRDNADSAEQLASDRLAQVKGDYVAGEITAKEWRELREELEPAVEALETKRKRLSAQLLEARSVLDTTDVEAQLRERLELLSEAIAAGVGERDQIAGVRGLLLEMFECFVFHPEPSASVDATHDAWLEPVIGAMGAPQIAAPRPDLKEVLKEPSPGGGEGWIWARVLGPVAVGRAGT